MKFPLLALLCAGFLTSPLMAELVLPPIFGDNAILLQSAATVVYGKADPGETVTVKLGDASASAQAGSDGKWLVKLDLSKSAPGPFDMTVEAENQQLPARQKSTRVVANVLVGEVWLCSGQSNMEWRVANSRNAKEEVAASANPMLRSFTVGKKTATEPQAAYSGSWQIAGPATTGGFTAVGYFFARELQKELQRPVGIIHSSWGGTPIEAWISRAGIEAFEAQKKQADAMDRSFDTYNARLKEFLDAYTAWQEKFNRRPADLAVKTAGEWKTVSMPATLPGNGLAEIRRTVKLPESLAGKPVRINLGRFTATAEVFWNGAKIGEIPLKASIADENSQVIVPAAQSKSGENVLSIRLFSAENQISHSSSFAVYGGPNLSGNWELARLGEFPALSPEAKNAMPKWLSPRPAPHRLPVRLYNAMIHPLLPLSISGVLWYQGESNAGRSGLYREATQALVEDWRKAFGGDFSFYWCQLANHMSKKDNPGVNSGWAELREAQTQATALPKTGQAILIDIGESGDIHPINKQDVGRRLAAVALAKDYGKKIPYSGPIYREMKIEGDKIRLLFDHIEGGLTARELPATYNVKLSANQTAPLKRNAPAGELEGFAVAGEDGNFFWAEAVIEGDAVVVRSEKVKSPTQVRYAWADNPTCNLYNKAGFPAVPFRTGK